MLDDHEATVKLLGHILRWQALVCLNGFTYANYVLLLFHEIADKYEYDALTQLLEEAHG